MTNQEIRQLNELTNYLVMLSKKNDALGLQFSEAIKNPGNIYDGDLWGELQYCYVMAFEHQRPDRAQENPWPYRASTVRTYSYDNYWKIMDLLNK